VEAIGLALDVPGNRLFATDLGGSVFTADLEGLGRRVLASARGNLTGIAYAELPITLAEK
jgi:hypothetical protein